jgi:hypothetical protein
MISLTYRLTGSGWALATIANEQSEMKIPASYLCDALRDFVDAVQSLFVADSAQCMWEQEPGLVPVFLFREVVRDFSLISQGLELCRKLLEYSAFECCLGYSTSSSRHEPIADREPTC